MNYVIVLKNEKGENIDLIYDFSFETGDVSRFKLIKYLDLYGDTIFNNLQMDDLIFDLLELEKTNNLINMDSIISLAKRCKNEVHTYLWFRGD